MSSVTAPGASDGQVEEKEEEVEEKEEGKPPKNQITIQPSQFIRISVGP